MNSNDYDKITIIYYYYIIIIILMILILPTDHGEIIACIDNELNVFDVSSTSNRRNNIKTLLYEYTTVHGSLENSNV